MDETLLTVFIAFVLVYLVCTIISAYTLISAFIKYKQSKDYGYWWWVRYNDFGWAILFYWSAFTVVGSLFVIARFIVDSLH